MIRLWRNGRLSWLFVALVAYCTAALVLFDYIWRVVVMPFPAMLAAGFGAWAFGVVVISLLFRSGKRREREISG